MQFSPSFLVYQTRTGRWRRIDFTSPREVMAGAPLNRAFGFGRRSFAGWRGETAAARAHALAELFAFFGRHLLPAFAHAAAEVRAMRASAEAPKEDTAESQQSYCLPEVNEAPSEQRRQQPVPEMHDHFTADCDEKRNTNDRPGNNKKPFSPHPVPHFLFVNSINSS